MSTLGSNLIPPPKSSSGPDQISSSHGTVTPFAIWSPDSPAAALSAAKSPFAMNAQLWSSNDLVHDNAAVPPQPKKSAAAAAPPTVGVADFSFLPAVTFNGRNGRETLGAGASAKARDAAEKRRRLEEIVSTLKRQPGRVSEEAIERVAKLSGLSTLWDPPLAEPHRRDGSRTLTIAGLALMVDVDFVSRIPTKVTAILPEAEKDIGLGEQAVSQALSATIVRPTPMQALALDLSEFRANIQRLALMESLSTDSFNCHTAVAGIFHCWDRLFRHERQDEARRISSKGGPIHGAYISAEVACRRSGRPRQNAHHQVGVSVEYWIDSRHDQARRLTEHLEATSDSQSSVRDPIEDLDYENTYFLQIECEKLTDTSFAKTSREWLSEAVVKPTGEVDWLEPSQQDRMEDSVPDIQFVARLFPPIPVPEKAVRVIYGMVGAPVPEMKTQMYDKILFAAAGENPALSSLRTSENASEARELHSEVKVQIGDHSRTHQTALAMRRRQYGVLLDRIPFSHPRALVTVLPILRQYVSIYHPFRNYFMPKPAKLITPDEVFVPTEDERDFPIGSSYISQYYLQTSSLSSEPKRAISMSQASTQMFPTQALHLGQGSERNSLRSLSVECSLSFTNSVPKLTISFPNVWKRIQKSKKNSRLTQMVSPLSSTLQPDASSLMELALDEAEEQDEMVVIVLGAGPNGIIQVLDHNLFRFMELQRGQGDTAGESRLVKRIQSALDVSADIGVWIEWLGKTYLG